jgi:hypothetical protein
VGLVWLDLFDTINLVWFDMVILYFVHLQFLHLINLVPCPRNNTLDEDGKLQRLSTHAFLRTMRLPLL